MKLVPALHSQSLCPLLQRLGEIPRNGVLLGQVHAKEDNLAHSHFALLPPLNLLELKQVAHALEDEPPAVLERDESLGAKDAARASRTRSEGTRLPEDALEPDLELRQGRRRESRQGQGDGADRAAVGRRGAVRVCRVVRA